MSALNMLSAVEAARQIAEGKISSESLVRDCLERIASREPSIHAWEHIDSDGALARAREADKGHGQGLLRGLPIGVKDLIDTCDMPTTYGSPIYARHRPAWDAPCVALSRAAGGIILGKTVTTEFAMMKPAKTMNPHDARHTPGGSSCGSAAAVADHMVPFAFGSQTAGSVIRPAAYCGVVGYKPSFGLISRVGVKALSDSLDTIGILARTVPDAALLAAAVTHRPGLLIDKPAITQPRVRICRTYEWRHAQPETVSALEDAARKLAAAGVKVSDVKLPPNFANLVQAQTDIQLVEQAQALAHERLRHANELSKQVSETIEAGLAISPDRYDAALALAKNSRRNLTEVLGDCDVLLAPSAPGAAPASRDTTGDPLFDRIWTLLHTLAVNIPCAKAANGMPVGLQVIGRFADDAQTLAIAHWLHRLLGEG
jgi:Asp-tRNA(Asn)/Glu-tRNA(Gln) amidotransferase A subunit family amidase